MTSVKIQELKKPAAPNSKKENNNKMQELKLSQQTCNAKQFYRQTKTQK